MARRPSETTEQNAATRYTARWHRIDRWAENTIMGDLSARDPRGNDRLSIRHGSWVMEEWNDEEAAERAIDLSELFLPPGPTQAVGGVRRVAIRLYTWVIEESTRSVYNPQWITTGQGFSAASAVRQHNRYLNAYVNAVAHGVESRRLGATAMQVIWWTSPANTPNV